MGYTTYVTGQFIITPPLTWPEFRDSKFAPDNLEDSYTPSLILRVDEDTVDTDTDEGVLVRRTATALVMREIERESLARACGRRRAQAHREDEVSTTFTWMCRVCGARAEGLDATALIAVHGSHECAIADLIRRAARLVRSIEHPMSGALEPVAAWLDAMAAQAKDMTGPDDFGITDEPGSVQYALAVARALPDEEEL